MKPQQNSILLGAGLFTAGVSLLAKLFAILTIYQSLSNINTAVDVLALVGEIKTALILLAIALVLDSVALLFVVTALFTSGSSNRQEEDARLDALEDQVDALEDEKENLK